MRAFEEGWDSGHRLSGTSDVKQLIAGGRSVYSYVVTGAMTPDGTIELVQIDIDVAGPSDELTDLGSDD